MSMRSDIAVLARGWRWSRRPLAPRSVMESGAAALRPVVTREFPTEWARSRPARAGREVILRGGLGPLIRRETTLQVTGLDVFADLEGPVIIIANHTSHLDTPLLLTTLPPERQRRVAVGAAADYFFDVWWRAVGSALAFATFPIERHGVGLSGTPARLLADGWSLVMFPEGTRSADGWARSFRPGAAALAIRHGVPLLPVAIRGSHAAMPRGRSWPGRGRPAVHVRWGRPLRAVEDENPVELTERARQAVARLLDEDSTDWWSAARRAGAGSTPPAEGPATADWRRRWATAAGPARPAPRRAWSGH